MLKKIMLFALSLMLSGCCFLGSCMAPQFENTKQEQDNLLAWVSDNGQVYLITQKTAYRLTSAGATYGDRLNINDKILFEEARLFIEDNNQRNNVRLDNLVYLDLAKFPANIQALYPTESLEQITQDLQRQATEPYAQSKREPLTGFLEYSKTHRVPNNIARRYFSYHLEEVALPNKAALLANNPLPYAIAVDVIYWKYLPKN